ncbi:MAG: hypothetical protein GEU88_04205 [Solirubrobacterales bacterium]|nr:hypothetical protein [Solirubrobacterales bacterium]
MPDLSANGRPSVADAEVAVARLESMSTDLRGCAVLAADGSVLAATGDPERWGEPARELLAAADAAAGEPVSHAHVATEDGEAFAVRAGGIALIAAAARFTLASLLLSDIRAVLRDLLRAPGAAPAARDAAAAVEA